MSQAKYCEWRYIYLLRVYKTDETSCESRHVWTLIKKHEGILSQNTCLNMPNIYNKNSTALGNPKKNK